MRVEFEAACYHVCCRGNERKEIFRSNQDRELFLKTLSARLERATEADRKLYRELETLKRNVSIVVD